MSLILFFALLASDVPASASTEATSPVPAADAASTSPASKTEAKKEKKICKADEATTGSRMVKRICLTRSQWDQRARSAGASD